MASSYSSNQTGAIATLLAGALFGIMAFGGTMISADSQLPSASTVFMVLIVIAWILIPFYAKRIKLSYVVGFILEIIALGGLIIDPGTPPWYVFAHPVFNFGFVIFYLIGIACIIFSYKSYKELK